MSAARARANPTRRALALIRVSKERDGMTSPEVQRHAIQSYADANNIAIADWVEGIDESGSRLKSAWWRKLDDSVTRLEAGEADTIIVWKFSRTARHRLKWAVVLDRVDTIGGAVLSVTEPIDTGTASGKFARGMLGELNAYQADLIGESWREAHERRVREGKPATGRARFGYVRDKDADTYDVDPAQAAAVAELYARFLAGHGMTSLTRWLNEAGHRTSRGNMWHTNNLKLYMDHGFPAGLIYANGEHHPGSHPPIIDRETWDAYRARRAAAPRGPRGSARMASGLLRCPCGGPMMATRTSGTEGTYACARRARGDYTCTHRVSIGRHLVEQRITEWIAELPARIDVIREAERAASHSRARSIEDRDAIARLITRTETRLANLTVRLADDSISVDAYRVAAAKLEADLREQRARHLRAAPVPLDPDRYARIPAMAAGFAHLPPAQQSLIARSLIRRIEISPAARRGPDPAWRDRIDIIPAWAPTDN